MRPNKIALMTDSCADLTPELRERYHIYTVPLRILCADGEYQDGVTIDGPEICRRLRQGERIQTSLPSTEEIVKVLMQIAEDGYDGILAVMLSGGLSGTYNLTRLAGEAVREEAGDRIAMRVYDSLSGSLGQAMTILQAARDLEGGMDWDELTERRIPSLIRNTFAFFSVDTLEFLARGGRMGKVAATAGTLLQIKPILTFAPDGQLTSIAKVRGRGQVVRKLVELAVQKRGTGGRYNLAVANGSDPAGMELVRRELTAALPDSESLWDGEIDATLSAYIGDGILGSAVQLLD